MMRHIICGLKREYIPYVTSIQGLAVQPTLVEFESLLTSQESLARQMAGCSISGNEGDALFSNKKKYFSKEKNKGKNDDSSKHGDGGESFKKRYGNKKSVKCYRCGKLGHIKKDCLVKLKEGYVAKKEGESKHEEEWGKCFMAGTSKIDVLSSVNYKNDWVVDSGCGHHLTSDKSKFSSFQDYKRNDAVITADNSIYSIKKEEVVTIKGDGVSTNYKVECATIGSTGGDTSIHNEPHTEISLSLSPNAPMLSESSLSMREKSNRGRSVELEGQQDDEEEESVPPLWRSKRKVVLLAWYSDENFVSMNSCFLANPVDDYEPSSFDEATGVKEWDDAMNDDMNALIRNQTWDLVPKPKEVKPITSKWV
jgi:hypothetical protein